MTEQERMLFEREKDNARRQFQELYRGNPKNSAGHPRSPQRPVSQSTPFAANQTAEKSAAFADSQNHGSQSSNRPFQSPSNQSTKSNSAKPHHSADSAPHEQPCQDNEPQSKNAENQSKFSEKAAPKKERDGFDLLRLLNFDRIEMDHDRLLLLMLCLLLSGEKADEHLLLALVYMML